MDGYYKVLGNLTEGLEVVTSANFLLSSESQLQGALTELEGLAEDVEWEKQEHEKLAQQEIKDLKLEANSVHGMSEHKKVIKAYLKLRKILAQDSLKGASDFQNEMLASLDALLKKPAPPKAFENLLRDIKDKVSSMNLKEIEITRKNFGDISELMIDFVDTVHFEEMTFYVFECSMYPGVWIQENDKTENPYYGSAMLKCGELISKK
jgi:Cu(I)/Ag(I) efflux system membrane fusion protein